MAVRFRTRPDWPCDDGHDPPAWNHPGTKTTVPRNTEFNFETKAVGDSDLLIDFLPSFRGCPGKLLRVAACLDDQAPLLVEVPGSSGKEDENGPNRKDGIQNNFVRARVPLTATSAGKHVLKIRAVDPGVVIEQFALPAPK